MRSPNRSTGSLLKMFLLGLHLCLIALGLALPLWLAMSGAIGQEFTFTFQEHLLSLSQPASLLLLALAPMLWLVPRFSLTDLPVGQRVAQTLLRTLILVALVLSLAGLGLTVQQDKVAAVILSDVSDSVPDGALAASDAYIRQALVAKRDSDTLAVVSFAATPKTFLGGLDQAIGNPQKASEQRQQKGPSGDSSDLDLSPLKRHDGAEMGRSTDMAAALRFAYGFFPADATKRVVLLSDGNQTEGNLLVELEQAASFGVEVNTVVVDGERSPEVFVQGVNLPPSIEVGAPFHVGARIFSTGSTPVVVSLWQDGFREGDPMEVSLEPGTNIISLPAQIRAPGFKRLEVQVEVPDENADTFTENNRYQSAVVISGKPRVLYVEGEPRHAIHLARALEREEFAVEVRGPHGLPSSIAELEGFDLVLMSDVPAGNVTDSQIRLLERYVEELGGGLIAAGGQQSFAPGGFGRTRLGNLLPVRFEVERRQDTPTIALMLVLDKSGSMMEGRRLELAKDAAKATMELLGPGDQIGVIAFDASPQEVVRLQDARNRVRIINNISRIAAGGGTNIYPALNLAYRNMLGSNARLKHVILLSDGIAPVAGLAELAKNMRSAGITVTTVAVGEGSDRSLMDTIAELGGGRSYFTNDPMTIPRIFYSETATVTRRALIEEPFRPKVVRDAQLLRGIRMDTAPFLLGYVSSKPKPGAEVILETEGSEPLLARWRVGLGTTAVWTSDVKSRWSSEWIRWRGFGKFWAQTVRDTMRKRASEDFRLRAEILPGGKGRVILDAIDRNDRFVNNLQSALVVTDPEGKESSLPMHQSAAGRYEGSFDAAGFGSYLIKTTHTLEGKNLGISMTAASNPYPLELTFVQPNEDFMRSVAKAGNGLFQLPPQDLFRPSDTPSSRHHPLRTSLLLLAAALFLMDLLLRRVRLWGVRN